MDWGMVAALVALVSTLVLAIVGVVKGSVTGEFNDRIIQQINAEMEKSKESDVAAWRQQNKINTDVAVALEGTQRSVEYLARRIDWIEGHLETK